MYRLGQLRAASKSLLGTRAVSSFNLLIDVSDEWYRSMPLLRSQFVGKIDVNQWEARGLDKTRVTRLYITGAGVHTSRDPYAHFTARAFDEHGDAVWFFDTDLKFYTNAIHFYPDGLPPDLKTDRFIEIPSEDSELIAWCKTHGRNIKTGKKD